MIYSWQHEQQGFLNGMLRAGKFPHALLFKGPEGTGKLEFAIEYARYLLCEHSHNSEVACGQCHSCQVFDADTHPDYLHIAPADAGKMIGVDEIRDLTIKLNKTSQFGRYTVAVIQNAEQLNRNSANALLKTLEEPTPNTVLILVCSYPHRLLPTIRSRCVQLDFPVPEAALATEYLQQQAIKDQELYLSLAHGSPLKAQLLAGEELAEQRKALLKNLIKVARGQAISLAMKEIDKIPAPILLDWAIDFCDDLIRVVLQPGNTTLTHIDIHEALHNMAASSDVTALYDFRDLLIERKKQSNIALNAQLLLEDLLLSWQKAFNRSAA
jgi:DNA polymerase-3 subunit delta'